MIRERERSTVLVGDEGGAVVLSPWADVLEESEAVMEEKRRVKLGRRGRRGGGLFEGEERLGTLPILPRLIFFLLFHTDNISGSFRNIWNPPLGLRTRRCHIGWPLVAIFTQKMKKLDS